MPNNSATLTVDTDDNKALRIWLALAADSSKRDKKLKSFLQPLIRQLGDLQARIERALLDSESPLTKRR